MRIVHFMRDRRAGVFSIERLYEDVRSALPADCEAREWTCRHPSKGLMLRLRDAWAAREVQAEVNHVTGDTHYLTYFLSKKRTILTVHDLVSVERSKGVRKLIFLFFWYWLPVFRSKKVIAVSSATKQALLQAVRCDPRKIEVINNPVSPEFKPCEKPFNEKRPRLLQIGTKPNKNIERVAQSLAGLPCELIIVGRIDRKLEETLARNGIVYTVYCDLTREEVLQQYNYSDILVFVSTYEGFGLPIIEANAVGRPVVTSNIAPMTVIAGGAACLVDPFDISSIRAGITKVIHDADYRQTLIHSGFENAKRFSVKTVAEEYARVYREVAQ
jgi:glycosyltransferase involved in cell wall biosynthesis